MDHYLELWLTEHEVWAEFYCVIEWACVLDWSLSLLQFPQMQRSQIKFGWISIFQINWPSFYLFLFFFIIASWLEDIVWDSLAEWRRSNSATVFSKASTRGTYWLPERLLVNCFADDRRQKSISKAHISLSEHLGIGLLSDRSSPLPLHWLSPQEESSRLQLQPLSHYANYFPAEKLHAWCPSIQRGLQFEYMHFFFLSSTPHFLPPHLWKECLFLMHSTGVHIAVVGNRKSSYPINLYNPLWRVCLFSMVRSEIIQMYGEYQL